jgi:hypothetical protein
LRDDTKTPLSCEYLFYHSKFTEKSPPHEGTTPLLIRSTLEDVGQPIESAWPYMMKLPSDLGLWKPPNDARPLFRRGSQAVDHTFSSVVAAVEAHRPTIIGMSISSAFFTPDADGVIHSTEAINPVLRHAVIAVGTASREAQQLLLVRNSWGTTWGIDGYAWLSEQYATPRLISAFTLN